ncbi:MAG: hypothetical protein ABEJ59_01560 [Halanaeroarchaeum sp.]
MSSWACAISECEAAFDDLEALLAHQVSGHDPHECRVCGEVVPAGFFAIQHAFDEHSRADYVRHYDADSDAIRDREHLKAAVESAIDVGTLRRRLEAAGADGARAEAVK